MVSLINSASPNPKDDPMQTIKFIAVPVAGITLWLVLAAGTLSSFAKLSVTKEQALARGQHAQVVKAMYAKR
jgi:hypothetical protein